MKVLVIDNFDSFTHTLIHYITSIGSHEIKVCRNDSIEAGAIAWSDSILLSPGPGLPEEAGHLMKVIDDAHRKKSILGVCLGHQALATYFGAKLVPSPTPHHGFGDALNLSVHQEVAQLARLMFRNIPSGSSVGRYHSWTVDPQTIPSDLKVLATGSEGAVMAFAHNSLPLFGVQFHPESILTDYGYCLLQNWLQVADFEKLRTL